MVGIFNIIWGLTALFNDTALVLPAVNTRTIALKESRRG